jgi:hypothetical protein
MGQEDPSTMLRFNIWSFVSLFELLFSSWSSGTSKFHCLWNSGFLFSHELVILSLFVAHTQTCMCPDLLYVNEVLEKVKTAQKYLNLNVLWENQMGSLLYGCHWNKFGLAKKKMIGLWWFLHSCTAWQNKCTHTHWDTSLELKWVC